MIHAEFCGILTVLFPIIRCSELIRVSQRRSESTLWKIVNTGKVGWKVGSHLMRRMCRTAVYGEEGEAQLL